MKILLLALLLLGVVTATPFKGLQDSDPEESMTVPEIIRFNGYECEEHHVTTEDGYILEMHRIPHGLKDVAATNGPVFLQHGLFCSSADWVLNVGTQNLGFLLADAGYDVWMGNIRGNRYSRAHTRLNPDTDREFWEFSWQEMAEYDIPTMLDYVLKQTERDKIKYIGFSMGTSMMFAALSDNPEFGDKIESFHALAPVAFLKEVTTPLRLLAPFVYEEAFLLELLGQGELLPSNALMKFLGDTICQIAPKLACESVMFVACGYDPDQMNATRLPVYVAHTPAGSSVQTVVHYAQLINSGKFQKFDYGMVKNIEKYGQLTPPEYDVSKITPPVYLYWGNNDQLGDKNDIQELLVPKLKTMKANYRVPFDLWEHLDFIWGLEAKELLYDQLMELLQSS